MTTLLDLTPVLLWGKGGLVRWSVVKAPVMFLDEPMTNLKVLQRDPAWRLSA